MKRRDFLKNTTITAAGSAFLAGMPLQAGGFLKPKTQRVILCVVAGITQPDFISLFPTERANGILKSGKLMANLRYNGFAAGHRLALESILNGRYFTEAEANQKPLANASVFQPGKRNYLFTEDRNTFTYATAEDTAHATHLLVSRHSYAGRFLSPPSEVYSLKPTNSKNREEVGFLEKMHSNSRQDAHHLSHTLDGYLSEMCGLLLKNTDVDVMVAHYMGADEAHTNASRAEKNRDVIRNGIQHIWESALMDAQETLFIAIPDFGRNSFSNSFLDENGTAGNDHTVSDENVKKIACLVAHTHKLPNTNFLKESTDIFRLIKD